MLNDNTLTLVNGRTLWLVLLIAGVLLLGNACASLACSEAERDVLAEFPQYGSVDLTPEGSAETSACAVYYETDASPEEVETYFNEQLQANGWTIEPSLAAGTLLEAQRGDFSYVVLYEDMASYVTPRAGTYLAVHMRQN